MANSRVAVLMTLLFGAWMCSCAPSVFAPGLSEVNYAEEQAEEEPPKEGAALAEDTLSEDAANASVKAEDEAGDEEPLLQPVVPSREPVPLEPGKVAVWHRGRQTTLMDEADAKVAGLFVLDLGTSWVPELFRSGGGRRNNYESVFIDLANGRFDDSPEGRRAKEDKYLELYGIPPTPALLEARFQQFETKPCVASLQLERLRKFSGVAWDEDRAVPDEPVPQGVVDALQERLICAGHLAKAAKGRFDGATRRALEEFERRNRIYARADLNGPTLEALQQTPLELERRALVRTLTERMILDLGIIEDGSGKRFAPKGHQKGGKVRKTKDLTSRADHQVAVALGLTTLQGLQRFYDELGPELTLDHYYVAIDPVDLPKYYSDNMDLFVEIDRGDVYYEFPMDDEGKTIAQPVDQGPTLILFARDGKVIHPLVRYRTTIGGWREERVGDEDFWVYKESPVGPRQWIRVESGPVWFPPVGTPPDTLVSSVEPASEESPEFELNKNIVGPSYASAYGLVAAYHERVPGQAGPNRPSDEGIRSHGTSDYTSIWRRFSHGCHRLYNHQAVRLFSFVLAHRSHRRTGHRSSDFSLPIALENFSTSLKVSRTGYAFDLSRPVPVEVLPGRIRGLLKVPPSEPIPAAHVGRLQAGGAAATSEN